MIRNIISHIQTDVGRVRQQNEDNFAWLQSLWGKPGMVLVGVIDGVGGYRGGAEASAIAKNVVEQYLQNFSFGTPLHLLKEAFINVNNTIHDKRSENSLLHRMSCVATLSILDAEKELMYVAHVGDSRGYVYRNKELIKITKDHSSVGYKEDNGYFTEEEAMHHPNRNMIDKMLGEYLIDANDTDGYFDFFEHSFIPGDIVLLCSDGLTDLVTKQGIVDVLSTGERIAVKVQQLIDKANALGGKDNITVALATYEVATVTTSKTRKKTIEVPIKEEKTMLIETQQSATPRKKKEQWWWLLAVFLVGFLANWPGTKKMIIPKSENPSDTIYIRDTIVVTDVLMHKDSLIQATDTIFKNAASNVQAPTRQVHEQ